MRRVVVRRACQVWGQGATEACSGRAARCQVMRLRTLEAGRVLGEYPLVSPGVRNMNGIGYWRFVKSRGRSWGGVGHDPECSAGGRAPRTWVVWGLPVEWVESWVAGAPEARRRRGRK